MDKKQIIKQFERQGLVLRPDSLKKIQEYLNPYPYESNHHLQLLLNHIKSSKIQSNILELQQIDTAITIISAPVIQNQQQNDENETIDIIPHLKNAINTSLIYLNPFFEIPKVQMINNQIQVSLYQNNQENQKEQNGQMEQEDKKDKQSLIFGQAKDKIQLFINRFKNIKYRLEKFSSYKFQLGQNTGFSGQSGGIQVQDIGSLLLNKEKSCFIMGIVIEGYDKQYYIQDEYNMVKMDISNATISVGYITDNCIIIAQGQYSDLYEKFIVQEFFLPQINYKKNQYKNIDTQGFYTKAQSLLGNLIEMEIKQQQQQKVTKLDREAQIHLGFMDIKSNQYFQNMDTDKLCVVVFSDFLLDDRQVLQNFEQFMQTTVQNGEIQPLAFILMGQFFSISRIESEQDLIQIRQGLENFLYILDRYPIYKNNSYFFLVPHINDIGVNIFPKPELPQSIFDELEKKITYLIRVSNPARICILGKEFIICRNDICKELRKFSIVKNDNNAVDQQLVFTILSQGHLLPINFYHSPVIWNLDHTLQFLEQPSFLILADLNCNQFVMKVLDEQDEDQNQRHDNQFEKDEIIIINPGSFRKKGHFSIIYPTKMYAQEGVI